MKIVVFMLLLGGAGVALGERVHLEYTAVVQTVSGEPFGLSIPRSTRVQGCFGYDTAAPDSNPGMERGDYPLAPGGYFLARFLGHVLEGSGAPFLQVEDFDTETFRFTDGDDLLNRAGEMRFDGVADASLRALLAITVTGDQAFEDDRLPSPFPFRMNGSQADPVHTFTLGSSLTDRILLQFTSLRQVSPPVLRISGITLNADRTVAEIEWISDPDASYRLEWSITGDSWELVAARIRSGGGCTLFTDLLLQRFPEAIPRQLLYRVQRELSP